jgi:hypothetical protein
MALSIDAIHKPLNDFFIEKFRNDGSSPVFFRFDKFGSSISEEDFSSPALATETFSYLVNRIPIEDSDGLHVWISPHSIDDLYYYQLLGKCLPYFPADASDAAKESIINSFSQIKADALKLWESIRLVSVTGLMTEFRPSTAVPENWYDKSSPEWSTQSIQITQTTAAPASDSPQYQLWTLKANDAAMQKALGLNEAKAVEPTKMYKNIRGVQVDRQVMTSRQMEAKAMARTTASARVRRDVQVDQPGVMLRRPAAVPGRPIMAGPGTGPTRLDIENDMTDDLSVRTSMHDLYLRDRRTLNIKRRMIVDDYVGTVVPKQPVITSSVRISFAYRIVDIRRLWFMRALINDKSWYIPFSQKGQLTSKEQTGTKITAMPVGLVAVKNLSIEATWSAEDIERAKNATDFGPFKVSSQILNNKLSHEGIQIAGWLLEKMPELPPFSDPGLASQPHLTLTFKAPTPSLITTNQPFNVVVEASAGIIKVDLVHDGKPLTTISSRTNNEFIFLWDITSLSEANHILEAIGYDANGKENSRASVTWMNDTP